MLTVLTGDALEQLRTLPENSVQCCVTSPPYWGLRDYGTAAWEGGDVACDHRKAHDMSTSGLEGGKTTTLYNHYHRDQCPCGARRIDSQLGLEKTPQEYVAKMVDVFLEVRRVLRKDGTLWLNLSSSYAGSWGNYGGENRGDGSQRDIVTGSKAHQKSYDGLERWRPPASYVARRGARPGVACSTIAYPEFKAKDLVPIPWMVAMALQKDGWYLRSDIIWAKPNPMPESVTDRPTKSHEYLFLLTKRASYFYDAEAIKEKAQFGFSEGALFHRLGNGDHDPERGGGAVVPGDGGIRNKRSVWTVATAPYPEAHFATYPPDLIKPCIMAGSRVGDMILDPFAGSGTTGMVALELGRKAILIELNPKYCDLIRQRCDITPGLQLA